MRIARATPADMDALQPLRVALWPDCSGDELTGENEAHFFGPDYLILLAWDAAGAAVGFAEVALRSDWVNGCDTCPVAFLEGIYVDPAHRRGGIARALVDTGAAWARERGVSEFGSDAMRDDHESRAFHRALGFAETEEVVFFRRALAGGGA